MVSSIPMATASRAIDGGRRQYAKGALVFCMMASLVFFAPSARGRDTYAPKGREVFEPPVVRNQACTKDTDCQPGLNCERVEFHYSHDDVHRCAYLPTFVFPLRTPPVPSSEIGRPAPGWFQTGGPLSTGFPKTWDLKRGPLPPAPQGYMWTYAPEEHCWWSFCGRMVQCRSLNAPGPFGHLSDTFESYVLLPADWDCLKYFSSRWDLPYVSSPEEEPTPYPR
jgi:hypothetical protein